jgi:hypothetical protein
MCGNRDAKHPYKENYGNHYHHFRVIEQVLPAMLLFRSNHETFV